MLFREHLADISAIRADEVPVNDVKEVDCQYLTRLRYPSTYIVLL